VSITSNRCLREHQRLQTSGARGATIYHLSDELYLAIPQLAEDIPGQPAHINGGNSDVDGLIFRWDGQRFAEHARLPVPGGEDMHVFSINGAYYMATASLREGHDPYQLNTDSTIYSWATQRWIPFQRLPTFAAKQWHHFAIGKRHFLALAQGVTGPGLIAKANGRSCVFEWNGSQFTHFQTFEGAMGYSWESFELDGAHFLAYADHSSMSRLYRWNETKFDAFQSFSDSGGRAFRFFREDGYAWLAFANLMGESLLYRWKGNQFAMRQSLGGPGGREFALLRAAHALHLVRVCFIQGSKIDPKPRLNSQIYRWNEGGFHVIDEFETNGATEAAPFEADGKHYLVVANSLTSDIRFRTDTIVYRLTI
jgi:hypothetical protein